MNTRLLSPAAPFDSKHFRHALSQFATGVTIVTTRLADGSFFGLTASSFNSVSLEPPLVLWSLSDHASSLPAFTVNSHYVINVLGAGQTALAERFARRATQNFDGLAFDLSPSGLPILPGASSWFDCRNRSRYPEGDHLIMVGEVEACAACDQPALIYHRGQFGVTGA